MEKLQRLCQAVRTLSPHGEVRLLGVKDPEDHWVCVVCVGAVILVESTPALLDDALDQALRKVGCISKRMRAVLKTDGDPPPCTG